MYGSWDISVTDRLMDGWMEKWHIEVGALHCFSSKIYGLCSSNALYSESLQCISTRIIWYFSYLRSLLFQIKSQFLSLLKKKKELFHMKLFLCSSGISLRRYCQKILTKSGGFRKKLKRRDGHIGGGGGGGVCVYRKGIKPSAHYALKCFKTKLCDKSWI